jgi:hypothetical protein
MGPVFFDTIIAKKNPNGQIEIEIEQPKIDLPISKQSSELIPLDAPGDLEISLLMNPQSPDSFDPTAPLHPHISSPALQLQQVNDPFVMILPKRAALQAIVEDCPS